LISIEPVLPLKLMDESSSAASSSQNIEVAERLNIMGVFLSYARKDGDLAVRLQEDLQRRSISVWLDHDIPPGTDWENEIRRAIRASSGVIYLGTPEARDSAAVRGELEIANAFRKPIHPVFAKGRKWAYVAPLPIIPKQYIDIREEQEGQYQRGVEELADCIWQQPQPDAPLPPPDPPDPLGREDRDMLWKRIWRQIVRVLREVWKPVILPDPLQPSPPGPEPHNPYKGLSAFQREDAQDFFGREEVVASMVEEIKHLLEIERRHGREQEPRFMTVVGPSGSGKSSVVMAGLLPRLLQGKDIPGSNLWGLLPTVLPGKKPLEALAQALSQKLSGSVSQGEILRELQDRSICALHSYAQEIATQPGSRVILLVDQFEELFTETSDEEERKQFLHQLITAATEPENKVIVIVTLRVDFSDHPMHSPLLHRVIEAHRIAIPPMTVEKLHAVIEGPARLVGLRFEENLVGDLLLDIHGQEENLPLLQFTLTKLFERRNRGCLTRQAYEAIGRVGGALNQHAEETYNRLPADEYRRFAEVLFTRLINPGDLGQDATRRRVLTSELTFHDAAQNQLMQETRQAFIAAHLITVNQSPTGNATARGSEAISIYEISHEALISAWLRLAGWINTARDDMLVRQTLNNDIEKWEKRNRPDGLLYSSDRFADARAWAKRTILTEKEEEFLRASERYERERNRPMLIRLGIGLLIFLVIASSLGYTFYQRSLSTTVTTLQDGGPGSLRQVIHDAPPNSTITFASPLSGGKIVLSSGDIVIDKDLTLIGPNAQPVILSNNGKGGDKVHIEAGVSATFKNLSFQDSHVSATAFIENDEGDLTLDHCFVIGNTSDSDGGGIANLHGTLTLTDSEVSDNEAQGNGGGIYSWDGPLTLTGSRVQGNSAGNDGGGIYELIRRLSLDTSVVSANKTTSSDSTSNGGGVSVLDGELLLDSSKIQENKTKGYGGGLALLGTTGIIDSSVISGNRANGKGGGLAVEKNSESGRLSQAAITNMEVVKNTSRSSYYIGSNTAPRQADILGQIQPSTSVTVYSDASEPTGSPAPSYPPENSRQFLGTANLDEYCLTQYPHETVSLELTNAENIQCVHLNDTHVVQRLPIDPQKVCRWQYDQSTAIARLADYYDPASWQCYKQEARLGGITKYLDRYCQFKGYTGIYLNVKKTAYDWYCRDQDNQQISIAITDACQWHYNRKDAFDRLTNFDDPSNGWECWAPK
jgi:TIR domain